MGVTITNIVNKGKYYYDLHKSKGLCTCCTKPAVSGRTLCQEHRVKNAVYCAANWRKYKKPLTIEQKIRKNMLAKQRRAALTKEQRQKLDSRQRGVYKEYAFRFKSAHPCIDCGESDPIVLDFDHREPKEKKFSISACTNTTLKVSLQDMIEEIRKCDIRCANCHRRKTHLSWHKNQ